MNKNMEESVNPMDIDDSPINEIPVENIKAKKEKISKKSKVLDTKDDDMELVSCLRNERVIVRHIPKETGLVKNPRHILYGGMAENATRTFVVPRLTSGAFVNILTDKEKAFLEDVMGLEYNALSIYKRENNFWSDDSDTGISRVRLTKQDNYLDLSDPEDYIRYKILLANKDQIAPSTQVLQDYPKATYQFVIIKEGDEDKSEEEDLNSTMKCYKEFGKIEDDDNKLRVIIETIDGRPTSKNSKSSFLKAKINNLIKADSKIFLKVITDPLLENKVLIKRCIEAGLISNRGNYLYLRSDGSPLCENNEEPTLSIAAKYLNSPKHQELKFSLEAKLK